MASVRWTARSRELQTIFDPRDQPRRRRRFLHVDEGETLAIVGESGCGKSVTSMSLTRLIRAAGKIGLCPLPGQGLLKLSEREMRAIRGNDISMIFQDDSSSIQC